MGAESGIDEHRINPYRSGRPNEGVVVFVGQICPPGVPCGLLPAMLASVKLASITREDLIEEIVVESTAKRTAGQFIFETIMDQAVEC